jgi:hypothetical protein
MLYVANAARPELGLIAAPIPVLWVGAVLGVVAIPFYALGYCGVAALVSRRFATHGRVIAWAGAAGGALGAVIHGCTASFVRDALETGAAAHDPLVTIGASPLLVALWGVAAMLIVVASVAFAVAVHRGVPRVPRTLAWANPAVVTLAIALAGSGTLLLRAFVVPAAPNLAHIVFFALCARALRATTSQPT